MVMPARGVAIFMQPSMWTSYLYSEWLPRDMALEFARHGWQTLELSDEHAHDLFKEGDPLRVGGQFRAFAADHGVSFPQGHFYLCTSGSRPGDGEHIPADIAPADPAKFATAMDAMRRWVDLFNALGVKAGVLHAGGDGLRAAGWEEKRIFARRVEAVRRVAEYARGGPTVICLENLCPGSGITEAAELIRIADATGADNVGLCLDTGHANMSGVDSASFIRQAGSKLQALHIADNLGSNDDHMLPYGRGTVKWADVMKALREIAYHGLFNFEVPGESDCPKPVLMAKLDYALQLAKWMVAYDG